jgi:hypothetical protein
MLDDGSVREHGEVEWDRSMALWLEPTTEEEIQREEKWIMADNARMRKVALASEIHYLDLSWTLPVGSSATGDGDPAIRLRLLA